MNPTWKQKCVRVYCLKNKTKLESYRIRHRWVCSVLDQCRFKRAERMKREKTDVLLNGEHTDDSFDESVFIKNDQSMIKYIIKV